MRCLIGKKNVNNVVRKIKNVNVHTINKRKKMELKALYVLVSGGDGSYYPKYTFNKEWIKYMENLDTLGELEYDDIGCDGDGFHYDIITVPVDCTLISLGITRDCSV